MLFARTGRLDVLNKSLCMYLACTEYLLIRIGSNADAGTVVDARWEKRGPPGGRDWTLPPGVYPSSGAKDR